MRLVQQHTTHNTVAHRSGSCQALDGQSVNAFNTLAEHRTAHVNVLFVGSVVDCMYSDNAPSLHTQAIGL